MVNQFLTIIKAKSAELKKPLISYIVLKTMLYFFAIIAPLCLGRYLDVLTTNGVGSQFTNIIIILISVAICNIILKFFSELLNTRLDATLVFLASQDSIQTYFNLSMDSLSKFESAYMSSRIISDTRSVVSFLLNNIVDAIFGVIQGVIILCLIAVINIKVFFMVCLILPLCAFFFYLFRGKMTDCATVTKEVAAQYSAANQKQCANYIYIKLNGIKDISRMFINKYFSGVLSGFLGYRKMSSLLDMLIALMQLVATAFLLIVGGISVFNGNMSVGSFTAINSYFATLIAIVSGIVFTARMLIEANESIKRMNEILNQKKEKTGDVIITNVKILKTNSLSIIVDDEKTILENITKEFQYGKLYCIVGQNGCGKSSLLKALSGAYGTYGGQIIVNDHDLNDVDVEKFRRSHISYLPQMPVVFFETLDDIYSMGGAITNTELLDSYFKRLLNVDNAREFIENRLQANGSSVEARFSGGEKQKIAFACSCARDTSILMLDEPTSSMDTNSKNVVAEILAEVAKNRMVLCVTHDDSIIKNAHEIVRI